MKRYIVKKGEQLRETKNSSYIKVDRDIIKWTIDKAVRLQEANERELRADHR
jgi:hypothetical protein